MSFDRTFRLRHCGELGLGQVYAMNFRHGTFSILGVALPVAAFGTLPVTEMIASARATLLMRPAAAKDAPRHNLFAQRPPKPLLAKRDRNRHPSYGEAAAPRQARRAPKRESSPTATALTLLKCGKAPLFRRSSGQFSPRS
jgi:hypothetical protein